MAVLGWEVVLADAVWQIAKYRLTTSVVRRYREPLHA
jgi:hypothetical protein